MTQPRKHRYADMIRRWLDDDSLEVEWLTSLGKWESEPDPDWDEGTELRFKPRMIKCGDLEFPEPMRVAPKEGDTCWIATLLGAESVYWSSSPIKLHWIVLGIIHSTKEAAEAHASALIALTESKS